MTATTHEWIRFSDRLPTAADAVDGLVMTRGISVVTGREREMLGLWDWIPPAHPRAKEWWAANGFTEWKSPA